MRAWRELRSLCQTETETAVHGDESDSAPLAPPQPHPARESTASKPWQPNATPAERGARVAVTILTK